MKHRIVHIGLPKTGTSSLQQNVLPQMCQIAGYDYNPPQYKVFKKNFGVLRDDDIYALKSHMTLQNVVISDEGIVGWNPILWEENAERLLQLVGCEAEIILTLRDPVSLLTSVYLQKLQEGIILQPEELFLCDEAYENTRFLASDYSSSRFLLSKFCFKSLTAFYKQRFTNVHLVLMEDIFRLKPWSDLLSLTEDQVLFFQRVIQESPTINKSYSKMAVRLTFIREHVLNKIGAKSINGDDKNYKRFISAEIDNTLNIKEKPRQNYRKTLNSGLVNFLTWRSFLQNVVDQKLTYHKFELPDLIVNNPVIQSNYEFLKHVQPCSDD